MKAHLCLLAKCLNHCSTEEVFFPPVYSCDVQQFLVDTVEDLFANPSDPLFSQVNNLHVSLFSKLSLWPFRVLKASFVAVISRWSSIRSFSVIVFAFTSILSNWLYSAFL